MTAAPPARRLQRVLALSRFDALSLVIIAAPAALIALCTGDRWGAAVGTGVALCGAAEWHGRSLLQHRRQSSIAWLVASQLVCLSLILVYAWKLNHLVNTDRILALLPDFSRAQLAELFPDPASLDELLLGMQRLLAAALALTSLLYQGGMALYFLRSAPAARAVFAEPPVLARDPPAGAP